MTRYERSLITKRCIKVLRNLDHYRSKSGVLSEGLCVILYRNYIMIDDSYTFLNEVIAPIYKEWGGYSGDPSHPVPHPYCACPQYAYSNLDKWSEGYGASRRSLAAYILSELEKQYTEQFENINKFQRFLNYFRRG